MSKQLGKIYFLNDRDVYDGLASAKRQVTPNMLREFLLERGIFLSDSMSRDDFIDYISSLNLDYHDVQFLSEQLASSGKKENVRILDLDCTATKQELRDILFEVKGDRADKFGEVYQTKIEGNENKISVDVEYTEVDLSKTRLRQKREREALIEAEIADNGLIRIRFPDSERSEEIVKSIVDKLKFKKNEIIKEKVIDISFVSKFNLRSQFFTEIIKNMSKEGLNLHDVKRVAVESRITEDAIMVDSEQNDDINHQAKDMVHKALLTGNSVLTSKTCSDLMDRGFYIYRLHWQMIEIGFDNAKLEYDAFFSDAPLCARFSCQVLGIYPVKGDDFTSTRRPIPVEDASRHFSLLERAALKAYETVMELNEKGVDK